MSTPRIIGFIFARGGSKGLPGKNIAPLGGKPLIAHAIEAARKSRTVERVVVSTDDAEIARVAAEWGADVPFMRPAELARDDTPEWLAWRHALSQVEPLDVFVCIPATSPLRAAADIDACVDKYLEGGFDVVLTVTEAVRNPYFNMVTLDDGGAARLVIPPKGPVVRRQDAPRVFDVTTVCYAARPEFIRTADGIFEGRVGAVEIPRERAADIDTPLDLEIARVMMEAPKA